MEKATYDELNLTPISNNETYSRLRRTHNKVRPSDDLTRRADINQNTTTGVKQTSTKEAPCSTKVTAAVIITMIAILVLLTLTSIALSVATFSRLTSVQSKVASQIDNLNEDKTSELNLTQFTEIQNIISKTLTKLDDQVYTEINPQNPS